MGIPKAAVLPLPVWACPITSLPSSAGGMAPVWIGVVCSKPRSATVRSIAGLRPRLSKLWGE